MNSIINYNQQNPVVPDGEMIDLSIIIPVYNEEAAIRDVINNIQNCLIKEKISFEIIVVDDCSIDNTPDILKSIDEIIYLRHLKNSGYGSALKTGIKISKGKIIIITDGDGTYPNEKIPELVKEIDMYDMIVGARSMDDPNIPFIRKPAKWAIGKLANYLSGINIPDLNSGFRAFRKNVVVKFYKILPSGFSFTTTITLAMHCNEYKVKYIPIEYHKRHGKSKIHPLKDTFNFIQLIFRTIMYFNPLKIFLPVSGIIFLGFLSSFIFDLFYQRNLTDKSIILFSAFIQIAAIGLLADLIDKRNP